MSGSRTAKWPISNVAIRKNPTACPTPMQVEFGKTVFGPKPPRARSRWLHWGEAIGEGGPGESGPYLQRARSFDTIRGVPLDNTVRDQLIMLLLG
jgi:hypothetical protein